jgi:hypothetical protein
MKCEHCGTDANEDFNTCTGCKAVFQKAPNLLPLLLGLAALGFAFIRLNMPTFTFEELLILLVIAVGCFFLCKYIYKATPMVRVHRTV